MEKKNALKNEVIVHSVDDQIQVIKRNTSGMYQIYFYVNLFNSLENTSIISQKSLNKRTIEKLLNEILSTDRQENENRIEQFAKENNIQPVYNGTRKTCLRITIAFTRCCLLAGSFMFLLLWYKIF